jgi:hypothetical protein
MSHLRLIKWICQGGVVVFGGLAALCWYKASTTTVTDKNDKGSDRGIEFRYRDKGGKEVHVLGTAEKERNLNMVAAILTFVAVVLQLAALLIPSD